MSQVIHLCYRCRKVKATYSWYDEITGLTHHYCENCRIRQKAINDEFWRKLLNGEIE